MSITAGVSFNTIPRHVAIIMDGNGRWAKQRHLPRVSGHKAGLESVREIVQCCARKGIEVLTLFAFSSENWRRPRREVSLLLSLFLTAMKMEVKKLHENQVQLRVIGELSGFDKKLQEHIIKSQQITAQNTGLKLVLAVNYGGRWDITQATRKICLAVAQGKYAPEEVNESLIQQFISLGDLPEPDLFIRTGGEQRISNFLLWQLAYTEFYFTQVLWPDFLENEFELALTSFAGRQRRFGHTGEQIEAMQSEQYKGA